MSGHTPGPWTFIPADEFWVKPAIQRGKEGGMVIEGLSAASEEADARLIAAAPDLLSALNAMLTHMGMDEDEWNKPTFDQARAAIAKATK